ncbi:rho guanyl nucleotide exchange [Anopheles sinensis]|uniref:Rho guanyl nucleotide exchange n=1 Tax=Anopheles sinensis TaxID=74873 RepID=A0A084VPC9_ANOSI|nr:rho guanyl nucleotide exchange [Anopheles sinensis]
MGCCVCPSVVAIAPGVALQATVVPPTVIQLLSEPLAMVTAVRAVGATTAIAADVAVFVTTIPPLPATPTHPPPGGSLAIWT